MLKVGIMGANGYAGEELINILLKHPKVKIAAVAGKMAPAPISSLYPYLKNKLDLECSDLSAEEVAKKSEFVFLALPHKVSMGFAPVFLKEGIKVVDLSADFRLRDVETYEKWYEVKHTAKAYIKEAIYGLCEYYREDIKKARLIANPGCYPTSIILATSPLLKKGLVEPDNIICDSKSGMSGAGRDFAPMLKKAQEENSFKAYKINLHRHMPEIDQEIGKISGKKVVVNFVPHLVPMERGILSTIYLRLKKKITTKDALKALKDDYKDEYFVRVLDEGNFSDTKNVVNTNFCDISLKVFPEKNMCIAVSAIDNLVKGASGQAVQNMNIMQGFDEKEGL
ncbi:MAG: N-acetyl-gamma-glutamyl-phosphate reductase [Candidatus Omnitrophota bacterium]